MATIHHLPPDIPSKIFGQTYVDEKQDNVIFEWSWSPQLEQYAIDEKLYKVCRRWQQVVLDTQFGKKRNSGMDCWRKFDGEDFQFKFKAPEASHPRSGATMLAISWSL